MEEYPRYTVYLYNIKGVEDLDYEILVQYSTATGMDSYHIIIYHQVELRYEST